jgi:secondary thiamine-phosphate synthase enzyme
MTQNKTISIHTPGRSTTDITREIEAFVARAGIDNGLCNVFVHHTSASLIICENADPSVRQDLETWFAKAVPDGDPMYRHSYEGPDDMPAHIRSILTQSSLSIPVAGGSLALGTWQGVYLFEHRTAAHRRKLTLTVIGA